MTGGGAGADSGCPGRSVRFASPGFLRERPGAGTRLATGNGLEERTG